jgi:predicted dienelactone hydrolase
VRTHGAARVKHALRENPSPHEVHVVRTQRAVRCSEPQPRGGREVLDSDVRIRAAVTSCLLGLTSVLLGACADGNDTDATARDGAERATTTTLSVADAATAYSTPGPHPVGVATLTLDDGVPVEVWYPAVGGTTGEVSYDMRTKVPQAIRDLLTADVPAVYTIDAGRDAQVADGEFPLVVYSHGFAGIREASSFLTSHLASWGMIVAAPDHWSRDLFHTLGGMPASTNDPVDDLRRTRQLLESENTTDGSRFEGRLDGDVAAIGHSAGGGTVLTFAADDDVDGYVSLASGARSGASTTTTTATPQLPDRPSLFVAGAEDRIVPADEATRSAFELAPAPSLLWVLEGVGHNGFTDFCTFGNGTGIIGVAEASGLGAFLDAQPRLRALGEDGCIDPAAPVATTFPVVDHVVTSWLRSLFGIDPQPVGLGPEVAGEYPIDVTIETKT